ncbi:hypothetical protein J2W32_006514 [Variovorax boronicumulans]|uniref:DNA methylase adenine-specific domain-containing protein n=1 Tax=Variovorax boronicumulans TaxID=436515 RepID=A0AAW8DCA2_9BURK|nr:N-6 DNA methylase [Variovorax boronicumulans]MDP9897421.1 hypothetical protein [Variovorax boronicumulans]MDQ0057437.1 hypothetical protein [Variovorax boronicumulans]
MAKAKVELVGPDAHAKELRSLLLDNARTKRNSQVFADFCELSAIAISVAADPFQRPERAKRYLEIIDQYERVEFERFARMFDVLVDWLECGFADRLGEFFMSMEFGDKWKGQFFTPWHVSSLMAQLTCGDVRAQVEESGFITLMEPACGAGCMVLAQAHAIHAQGVNYQKTLHATAIDIDITAVHMTYIQLSLFHVPAIVIHGNALALAEWSHWVTPAHVMGGWDWRLKFRAMRQASTTYAVPEVPPTEPQEAAAEATRQIVAKRVEQLGLFS